MPLLCRKLLALGGQMKEKLTERKRTGLTGVQDGQAAVCRHHNRDGDDEGGCGSSAGRWHGGVFGEPATVSVSGLDGRGKRNVQHLLKVKLVAILSSMRRKTTDSCCYHGDGRANKRPRFPWTFPLSPFNPALHSFTGRFDTPTLSGPGSPSLTETHLRVSQTEKKNVSLEFKFCQALLHFGHMGSQRP